ncbi:MAG: hypothetical protein IKP95_04815 [Ruminococcus sp.]|nr:hypothetical protein [Ruminococcus sp.]
MKKRIMALILSALLCLSFAACGNSENSKENTDIESKQVVESTAENNEETLSSEDESSENAINIDPNRETDIRNTCWGDSREVVRSLESDSPKLDEGNMLVYDVFVDGVKVTLAYVFNEQNQLCEALYTVDDSDGSKGTTMVEKFAHIGGAIAQKYGNDYKVDSKKLSSLADYCDDVGEAVELGYIEVYESWNYVKGGRCTIKGSLTRKNYTVTGSFLLSSTSISSPKSEPGI